MEIWVNASPTSSFDSTTIEWIRSDFLGIVITYKPYGGSSIASSGFIRTSESMYIPIETFQMTDSGAPYDFMSNGRRVEVNDTDIIIHQNFTVMDHTYVGPDPIYNIPLVIYGLRA